MKKRIKQAMRPKTSKFPKKAGKVAYPNDQQWNVRRPHARMGYGGKGPVKS